jgi:hypothetical protein
MKRSRMRPVSALLTLSELMEFARFAQRRAHLTDKSASAFGDCSWLMVNASYAPRAQFTNKKFKNANARKDSMVTLPVRDVIKIVRLVLAPNLATAYPVTRDLL